MDDRKLDEKRYKIAKESNDPNDKINAMLDGVFYLTKKVDDIEIRVEKIENKVNQLEHKVDEIESKVNHLEHKVNEIENKVNHIEQKVNEMDFNINTLKPTYIGFSKEVRNYRQT